MPDNSHTEVTAGATRAFKSTVIVSAITVLAMAANLLSQSSIANFFGANSTTDAYMAALNISHIIAKLFLSGQIAVVFIPLFIETWRKKGKGEAWGVSANLFNVLSLAAFVFILMFFIAVPRIVAIVAPAFDAAQQASTVYLLRILLPVSFFFLVSALGTSMLNAMNRFTLPAAAGLTTPVFLILSIVFFAKSIGIQCLVWASVAAAGLNFIAYYAALLRNGFRFSASLSLREPVTAQALKLLAPLFANYFLVEIINSLYRVHLATGLGEGVVSIFNYSNSLYLGLLNVLMMPVMIVIFPPISERLVTARMDDAMALIHRCIRITALTALPASLTIAVLGEPVIRIIYQRGGFSGDDAGRAAALFSILAASMWVNTLNNLCYRLFFALKKTFILSVIIILVTIGQAVLMWYFCKVSGYLGLAIGPFVALCISTAVYFIVLNRMTPGIVAVFKDRMFLLAMAASGLNCLAVFAIYRACADYMRAATFPAMAGCLCLIAAFSAVLQLGLLKLFKSDDLAFFIRMIRPKISSA